MTSNAPIVRITGKAIALDGNDIDTDRLIPAKYLKHLTFDSLGNHVFEVDRLNATANGQVHPFDAPAHAGATVLLTAQNFGCGSSREHAAQALYRWGIRVIAGVSYGEIFRGNSATIGLPCVMLDPGDASEARKVVAADPGLEVAVDLEAKELRAGDRSWPIQINESLRQRFMSGSWDTLTTLASASDQISEVAARLPYLNGFAVQA
jgi:3-isopropylmalate/(R)-2-methylmalate dehydratase small subunit